MEPGKAAALVLSKDVEDGLQSYYAAGCALDAEQVVEPCRWTRRVIHELLVGCSNHRHSLSSPNEYRRSCQPIVRSNMSYHEPYGYPGLFQLNRSLCYAWLPSSRAAYAR